MLPLYERIESLCSAKGINITLMCKNAGVPRSALSDYKAGRKKTISITNLEKIAEYFEVTVDYLLGKEKSPSSDELDKQLDGVDFALYGEAHDLTDAEKRDVLKFIKFIKEQRGET